MKKFREMTDLFPDVDNLKALEEQLVKTVGDAIGYGRVMQLSQRLWRSKLGELPGAEFAIGPCVVATVNCDCVDQGLDPVDCDWCAGAGWVTKKVRTVQKIQKLIRGM